ncbi:hypothetical protein DPMN_062569 [Dreissena polymorpha]|uniref:HTH CENPB-type domain-containing protein n=1 Tax=Dreissena polymorpha TaxID=45954 RepID=A0A9D4HI90_DREPO|nr:hypothetical protein DPMN_062569 [Dreissena polymorpha]
MEEYESNGNVSLKRPKYDTEFSRLNDLVFKWFTEATARLINVSGPMIQEKAKKFAGELGLNDFKGSNGWLESFLKLNNIVFKTQSGERGEVKLDTVDKRKAKIASVCQGYEPKDIFNMDESGLFYRDSTKSTFFKKGETCAGGKRSKQRITVAVCASMTVK